LSTFGQSAFHQCQLLLRETFYRYNAFISFMMKC
jgi:hypothetical protein